MFQILLNLNVPECIETYTGYKESFLYYIFLTRLLGKKEQYKEDNGVFLILKEYKRNIMPGKVERYKDDTLSPISREESV